MPFIRYRVGDTGILSNSICPCGRRLPLIRSVEGRVLDVLKTRDGKVVPGEFFPHVLKDISEVREFQVQQTSLDEIVVYVVLNCPLLDSSRALLKRETKKVFWKRYQILVKACRGHSTPTLWQTPYHSRPRKPDNGCYVKFCWRARTMNIVHIVDSMEVGGAETIIALLCRLQRARGHCPSVYCLYEIGPLGKRLKAEGFEVILHLRPTVIG